MLSHHARLPPEKGIRPLDSQLWQRIPARERERQAMANANHTIEMPGKTSKSIRGPEAT